MNWYFKRLYVCEMMTFFLCSPSCQECVNLTVFMFISYNFFIVFEIHSYKNKLSVQSHHLQCSCVSSDLLFFMKLLLLSSSAGQSVRTRRILQEAHEEGRPCPNQLIQTKPCPIRPCYTWLLSDWSPCTVEV